METFVSRRSLNIDVSMARFANVAFSDGSLLHSFDRRIEKQQPIVAPRDIKRYFITPQESGELCLMSCLLGGNRDIFFPKVSETFRLLSFADIAVRYLEAKGFEPYLCSDEDEARRLAKKLPKDGKWPCLFAQSDTTGEKGYEEFFTDREILNMEKFETIGVIVNEPQFDTALLDEFVSTIDQMKADMSWSKYDLVTLFQKLVPDFDHKETGKYLDGKM
jgi:FlaA1/EpsC-like NDP-sugar epimerase